jgi:hypothetical protein
MPLAYFLLGECLNKHDWELVELVVYSLVKNRMPTCAEGTFSSVLDLNATKPVFAYPRQARSQVRVVRDSSRKYGASKRSIGPEAILHMAWRNAGLERAEIRGRDGHNYRIVYGGKPGGSLGPDFTDAVVERDDGMVFRGDIEIHVRESDWRSHGHHTDPRYNGVVLHVVAAEPEGRPAFKATGSTIPLLALNWKASRGRSPSANPSIDSRPMGKETPALPVGVAGLERFHSQAAGIALDIEAFGADQAIWLGVMGALGYPRNKRAFRKLATRVDWQMASSCPDPSEMARLLMRAGGLSDGERERPAIGSVGVDLVGSAPEWVRPWGRPANAPAARIKAISALVPIWKASGGIARAFEMAVGNAQKPKDLSTTLRPIDLINDDGVTVLGAARAAEIVVNVMLPCVLAMAMAPRGSAIRPDAVHLKNRSIELFSTHPKLSDNSVTKEAIVALGLDYEIPKISNARDQQGLISLYREMFRHGIGPRQPRLPGV